MAQLKYWDGTAWVNAVVGVQGPTGPTGAASTVTGPTGPTGATGAASTVTGPTGPTGATGAASTVTGPTGPTGATGAASTVTGPTGPTGATGAASTVTGPTGPTGPSGPVNDLSFNAQIASYTLVLLDKNKMIEMSNASANTLTIPTDSVDFPVGSQISVMQTGAGQTSIAGDSGVTVEGTPGLKLRSQWSAATVVKRASNSWVAMGDLSE